MRDYLTELVRIIGYHAHILVEKGEFLSELHRHNPDLLLLGPSNYAGHIRAVAEVVERQKSGTPILAILDDVGTVEQGKIPRSANLSCLSGVFDTDGLKQAIDQLVQESRDTGYKELDDTIIGQTPAMMQIKRHVVRLAKADVTILICGESGTGKELVARGIHKISARAHKPFIKVNSAALPINLLESELFGFEKGAFTGAFNKKLGKFELAHTGTILLDEVGEIPLPMQAKLLQVLQDSEFSALGSTINTRVDARVLAATNTNLSEMVARGQFRPDLYYRLNVVSIHIPPLRDRQEDIDLLCKHFFRKYAARYDRDYEQLSDRMREGFYRYSWPGNIRELENIIQSITVLGAGDGLSKKIGNYGPTGAFMDDKGPLSGGEGHGISRSGSTARSLKKICKEAIRKAETKAITEVLFHTRWNRRKAATFLEISYKALLNKIKEYGIERRYDNLVRKDDKSDDYEKGVSA
jgi:two-component system response regulator AtoC